MSVKNDSMKEFLKYYLSDICFEITFQLRSKIHLMIIIIQMLTLLAMFVLKIIFKDNQTANMITSITCCIIVWLCCFFTIGTSFIVNNIRKKNQLRINNYYKYLDSLVLENVNKEMISFEDDDKETSENN